MYPAIVLNSFFQHLLVDSSGFPKYRNIMSENRDNFFFLPSNLYTPISLSCLIALRLLALCWIKVVREDTLTCSRFRRKSFSFSVQHVSCEFVIGSLHYAEDVASLTNLFLVLPWGEINFFQVLFLQLLCNFILFLFFILSMWCITLFDLNMLTILTSLG
jgi:hypothetical protein